MTIVAGLLDEEDQTHFAKAGPKESWREFYSEFKVKFEMKKRSESFVNSDAFELFRYLFLMAPAYAIGLWQSFVTPSLVSNDLISPPNKEKTSGRSALTMMLDSLDSYLRTISTVNKDSLLPNLMSLNHEFLSRVAIQEGDVVRLLFPLPNFAPNLIFRSERHAQSALAKILRLIKPYNKSEDNDIQSEMTKFLADINGRMHNTWTVPLSIGDATVQLKITLGHKPNVAELFIPITRNAGLVNSLTTQIILFFSN